MAGSRVCAEVQFVSGSRVGVEVQFLWKWNLCGSRVCMEVEVQFVWKCSLVRDFGKCERITDLFFSSIGTAGVSVQSLRSLM